LEQFKPGAVYHCDSLILDKKVIFSLTSKYLATPMEISQGGGVLEVQIFHMDQMMIKKQ
jgi:hypothetical protein